MKKRIKLSESDLNRIVKRVINEISYGLVDNASSISDKVFYDMEMAFQDFYDTIKYNVDTNNPYVKKIKEYADAIGDILSKKSQQRKNFEIEKNKFDYKDFYSDKDAPDDYDKLELRDLQSKYPKNIPNTRFDGRNIVNK